MARWIFEPGHSGAESAITLDVEAIIESDMQRIAAIMRGQ